MKTCPSCDIPETFYLNTSANNSNKTNKCARHSRYKKEAYIFTSDSYNGHTRHIIQLCMPNFIDAILLEREPIIKYKTKPCC